VSNAAAGSGRAFRRREARRLAKILANGAGREDASKQALLASAVAAVSAPQRSAFVSWITRDFSLDPYRPRHRRRSRGPVFIALMRPDVILRDVAGTHLAVGNWIIARHAVPRTEIFSWWQAGKPWMEWACAPRRDFASGHCVDHRPHGGSESSS
jgi:hypothetical protein